MNNDKSIKLYKKNFFSNIINFFKELFNKTPEKTSIIDQETNESDNNNSKKSVFLENIKLKEENIESTELQIKLENNEIDFDSLSNEEIHSLNLLYKKQVEALKKRLDHKKIELNMLKFQSNNNLAN